MPETAPDLGELIDMQIRATGPISLATYMGLCLTHPTRGYYRTADPLGAGGDFITAPEISQMYGELIGAFIADLYAQMGSPPSFTLLELGPGRGTLAADALRVATRAPGLREALTLAFYETNPALVALQRRALAPYAPIWVDAPEDIPAGPVIVIASEFFDALPVRQFVKRGAQWHERRVGLDNGARVFGLDPTPFPETLLPEAFHGAGDGAVAEIGLAAEEFMARLARVVAPRGGAILIIDYGYDATRPGDTLQAVARHAYADPLADPGAADLSTHVNFEVLGRAARMAGLTTQPIVTQGLFLSSLGLEHRAAALAKANPNQSEMIARARDRLVGEEQMGRLFKVLCAGSPGLSPAGFAPGGGEPAGSDPSGV